MAPLHHQQRQRCTLALAVALLCGIAAFPILAAEGKVTPMKLKHSTTGMALTASSKCLWLHRQHEEYEPLSFCPDRTLAHDPVHEGSFSMCAPFLPRRCVTRTPANYTPPPSQTEYRHNPPSDNVYRSELAPHHTFDQLEHRVTGDCITCWRFAIERKRWDHFIDDIEHTIGFPFRNSPIRNVLDFGAGSGGFLSAMMDRGVFGLGFARGWQDLPYLETAAARGAMVMHMDFRQQIPMTAGAVDMIHCSWLFNILSDFTEMERVMIEWDRLVRPDGLIVQNGFRSETREKFDSALAHIHKVATFLQWKLLAWREVEVCVGWVGWVGGWVCVCERERERECVCVCECVYVRVCM